jgi:hypothetical protein
MWSIFHNRVRPVAFVVVLQGLGAVGYSFVVPAPATANPNGPN